MATAEPVVDLPASESSRVLAEQWRRLRRSATFVFLLTSPAAYVYFTEIQGWSPLWSIVATFFLIIAFRGVLDLIFKRAIPWPSLFGSDSARLREEDVVARRRVWFWRFWVRTAVIVTVLTILVILGGLIFGISASELTPLLIQVLPLLVLLPIFLIFNFVILFGPLLMMNLSQIQAFEPG